MFVTSDGNPYARFKRALETGNEALVTAAPPALPRVPPQGAPRVCLGARAREPDPLQRAAGGWLGRGPRPPRRMPPAPAPRPTKPAMNPPTTAYISAASPQLGAMCSFGPLPEKTLLNGPPSQAPAPGMPLTTALPGFAPSSRNPTAS